LLLLGQPYCWYSWFFCPLSWVVVEMKHAVELPRSKQEQQQLAYTAPCLFLARALHLGLPGAVCLFPGCCSEAETQYT
jgi:hypothetical protein